MVFFNVLPLSEPPTPISQCFASVRISNSYVSDDSRRVRSGWVPAEDNRSDNDNSADLPHWTVSGGGGCRFS